MPSITHILAVDGGGTKTEAALHDRAGTLLARARTGPCNLYQDAEGGLRAVEAAWHACCTAAGLDPDRAAAATCLSAGLAGVNAGGAAERFHAAFAGFAQRRLSSDGYTALIGAFDGAAGALLSIGTGVVAYRLDAAGRFRMLSGWGHPAGDRGGGAWLGLRLIGDWLEALDGYGPAPADHPLWQEAAARIGGERAAILAWLKAARPGDIASLARPIVDAAAAGDAYARGLIDEAASHHRRLARALAPSADEPLVLGGGLAPVFALPIAAALPPGAVARERRPSPLRGAWLIGTGRATAELPTPER
jgi:glucosamine kinase